MRRILLLFFILSFISLPSKGADLSINFSKNYQDNLPFTQSELATLKAHQFYLVPGILSETFIWDDQRSKIDFSLFTRDYFSAQAKFLRKEGLEVERLKSSSYSVDEIKSNIQEALGRASKKVIFITHSLGGLALLEELLVNNHLQDQVAGVIFLQSPFQGTPMADVYLNYPYKADKWLKPLLPFFNTSEEVIRYLSPEERSDFMTTSKESISLLLRKIPVITVGGVVNGYNSLFKPAVDIIETGCIKGLFSKCLTQVLHQGPYDESDGMVPFKSSRLQDADYVKLKKVDHGETVVSVLFGSYQKAKMTNALLKLLIPRLN